MDNLLEVSRVTRGKMRLQPEAADLVVHAWLEELGHQVHTAADGAEGLELARTGGPRHSRCRDLPISPLTTSK